MPIQKKVSLEATPYDCPYYYIDNNYLTFYLAIVVTTTILHKVASSSLISISLIWVLK
jgi:hypothetical protein